MDEVFISSASEQAKTSIRHILGGCPTSHPREYDSLGDFLNIKSPIHLIPGNLDFNNLPMPDSQYLFLPSISSPSLPSPFTISIP